MGATRRVKRAWRSGEVMVPWIPWGLALTTLLAACSGAPEPPASAGPPPTGRPAPPVPPTPPPATAAASATTPASASASAPDAAPATAPAPASPPQPAAMCPADMAYVDTTYCPRVQQRCIKDEYNKPNHITICHEFAPGQVCVGEPRRQRFCIDRYEFPNQAGAHPPVMVSWYDAAGACAARGKRLCWESEWVSACEGPEKLPFPYGLKRDAAKCNIDNPWLKPDLDKMYDKDPAVAGKELLRLDQSAPSGGKPGCVSGFGVHDLTGNLDEWVNAEKTYEQSRWAGLKGGAWGHVRNACRPMTTSHPPEFTYYFISFRCCADPAADPAADKDPALWVPPPQPKPRHPGGAVSAGWTPRERGPNQPPVP